MLQHSLDVHPHVSSCRRSMHVSIRSTSCSTPTNFSYPHPSSSIAAKANGALGSTKGRGCSLLCLLFGSRGFQPGGQFKMQRITPLSICNYHHCQSIQRDDERGKKNLGAFATTFNDLIHEPVLALFLGADAPKAH